MKEKQNSTPPPPTLPMARVTAPCCYCLAARHFFFLKLGIDLAVTDQVTAKAGWACLAARPGWAGWAKAARFGSCRLGLANDGRSWARSSWRTTRSGPQQLDLVGDGQIYFLCGVIRSGFCKSSLTRGRPILANDSQFFFFFYLSSVDRFDRVAI